MKKQYRYNIIKDANGLLRTDPTPSRTVPTNEDFKERLEQISLWELFAKRTIENIQKYEERKDVKVLDIGANIGVFLKVAAKYKWKAIGIDVDNRAIEIAKHKLGVKVLNTDLSEARFNNNEFNVCILCHTLEHIYEPHILLREIKRILKKDGILYIEVPNIEGLPVKIQKLRKESWYGLDPERHVWHFTSSSIRKLLESEGFIVLELSKHTPLYYQPLNGITGKIRDIILGVSGLINMADQIIVVAKPLK